MTPSELGEMTDIAAERAVAETKERWKMAAFVAASVINSAGKVSKKTVEPDDLVTFGDESKQLTPEMAAERKRQAQETLLRHKAKFWTLIKDENVTKITGERP